MATSAETRSIGWFSIPGVQDGPRTLAEQMLGLSPALAETPGKTVLDLGCAEGLIALEFAKAGAVAVDAYDYNADLLLTAGNELRKAGPLPVTFAQRDLAHRKLQATEQYDIVLALAILHKLPDPAEGVRFCAQSARSLIVIRLPKFSSGVIRCKHFPRTICDLPAEFRRHGFKRERKEPGPRGEWVQYWRRIP